MLVNGVRYNYPPLRQNMWTSYVNGLLINPEEFPESLSRCDLSTPAFSICSLLMGGLT